MRRWFAVILLALLPLQFSWAAVANHCQHQAGAAADHVGHHDHAGHSHAIKYADPGGKGKADGNVPRASNLDCGWHSPNALSGRALA